MQKKYSVGDIVVYDVYGICKISEIKKLAFSKSAYKEDYYVLSPLNSPKSIYYIPVSGDVSDKKLRLPLTEKEINYMLDKAVKENITYIEKRQLRLENYNNIINRGITSELVALIGCLFERRVLLENQGKKMTATDETFFATAENMLKEEFSFSLGLPLEKVPEYIYNFMKTK